MATPRLLGAAAFVLVLLLALSSYPSLIRWRLESRGWEIDYAYRKFTEPPPRWLLRFMEPWFSDCAAVRFREASMSADDVRLLSRLPRVWALDASGTTISEPAFEAISQLAHLQVLEIEASRLEDNGLQHLSQLPRLETLELNDMTLSAAQVSGISSCGRLRVLRLSDVKVADEDLAPLSKLTQLRSCWLHPSQIGDQGLEHLAKITTLRCLILTSKNITDAGIRHLRHLSVLEELDLDDCQVTNQGIKEIAASCRSIKTMILRCPSLTDAVLTDLAVLPSLEYLALYRTPISINQFRELRRYPVLTYLTLSHDKVDAVESSEWDELKRVKPKLEMSFR